MRVLLDTNILIYREDDHILDGSVQTLMKNLGCGSHRIVVHPASIDDLKNDANDARRSVVLSKVAAYPLLESPPDYLKDETFNARVVKPSRIVDDVDMSILYAVFKNAVDILVTEDRGIHKNASKLGIGDRVLLIHDAAQMFDANGAVRKMVSPPALRITPVHNLDLEDSIFDSLRREYSEFDDWLRKISRQGRLCWVYHRTDGSIGALLIFKDEDEAVDCNPPLSRERRMKICLFKVTHFGQKIGELLMKLSLDYAREAGIEEVYLTHFTTVPEGHLAQLIGGYGFFVAGKNTRGENVYLKRLLARNREWDTMSPLEFARRFFPSFYDGEKVNKYIVPIRPEFHVRLFTDFPGRQTTLPEHSGEFIIEGNTIRKAYLCHSRIRKMKPGDVVLFYRSRDWRKLTHLGVVEEIHHVPADQGDAISRLVMKRTAYSTSQLNEIARKPTTVVLFMQHFCLPVQIPYNHLLQSGIIKGSTQSITQISDSKYDTIKRRCGFDLCFAVN